MEVAYGASGKPARSATHLDHGDPAVRRYRRGRQPAQSGADDHHAAGCAAMENIAALSAGQRRYLCTHRANNRTWPLLHAGALASGIYERPALLFDRSLLHG